MLKRLIILKAGLVALGVVGVGLLGGCGGLSQRPLSPDPGATVQKVDGKGYASDGPFTVTFSPKALDPSKALRRATKPTAVKTAMGVFSYESGGELEVGFDTDSDVGVYVKKAKFEVAEKSISRDASISMTVYSGSTLQDIDVVFTPSGLTFNPSATLKLAMGGTLSADTFNGLTAYLIDPNAVTAISYQVSFEDNQWYITIQVPGFSIYSLGDGLVPETLP